MFIFHALVLRIISAIIFIALIIFIEPAWSDEEILSRTWPLSHFMINSEPILLKNVEGSYSISFPIADRIEPDSVELKLYLSNSNLLNDRRAQFAVFINGYVAGQIKLNPVESQTQVKFRIAKEYLKKGYNRLVFKAIQHYTASQCEDWSTPELWTSVDSVKSKLTLHYTELPVSESLAKLNGLISDRLDHYSLTILRSRDKLSDAYLYWGAMLAQGVKRRLQYVPLTLHEQTASLYRRPEPEAKVAAKFNIDPKLLSDDAILVGTKEQIQPLLSDEIGQTIQGAYLGLFRQDKQPEHFILVVSGLDDKQVKTAVQAFVLLDMPLPDADRTIIHEINFPAASTVGFREIVPGNTYRFSQLGFNDKLFNVGDTRAELQFRIPADMYSTEQAMVSVDLDLAYGAAMRKDSAINISLNELFNHAIQLKESSGAHYYNYRIDIPLRSFQHGMNRLSFDAVMTPSEFGECTFIQRANLITALYRDSTVTFPQAGRVATLPDLQLFERTGFPLIKNGSAQQTVIGLLDTSSDSVIAAWHFFAKLTTFTDAPVFDVEITQNKTLLRPNKVLIGKPAAQQPLLDAAPVRLGVRNQFPYRYKAKQLPPEETLASWLSDFFAEQDAKPSAVDIEPENVTMSHSAGLGGKFLLMSYRESNVKEGVVFALLSEPGRKLYPGLTELLTSELWGQMQGNVFIWDKQRDFNWLREGDTFEVGDSDPELSLIMHFSNHPWQWLALIVTLLLLTAWLIHRLLTRFASKHHHPAHEDVQ